MEKDESDEEEGEGDEEEGERDEEEEKGAEKAGSDKGFGAAAENRIDEESRLKDADERPELSSKE